MTTPSVLASGLAAAVIGLLAPNPLGENAIHRSAQQAQPMIEQPLSPLPPPTRPLPVTLESAPRIDIGLANTPGHKEPPYPQATCSSDAALPPDNESAGRITLGRGDRVKLSFYEVLQSLDGKWGADHSRYQEPARTFQLHEELSNEYLVQDDGSLVIPLLGRFDVDGRTTFTVKHRLECAFIGFLGRSGFVNIANVVKRPVFVVGTVTRPGSVEFTPGMTVLQAIALAGGFEKEPIDPNAVAQLVRETERLRSAVDRAVRMIARVNAINAAAAGNAIPAASPLDAIVGSEKSHAIVGEEFSLQETEQNSLLADEASLKGTVDAANRQLELRKAAAPLLQESLDLRRDRVDTLTKLAANGSIGRPVLLQAQTELLDAQQRTQEAQNIINQAEEQLRTAKRELEMRKQQTDTKRLREEAEARRTAGEAAQEADAAADLILVMNQVQFNHFDNLAAQYKVVRHTATGPVELAAAATTTLQPGDLVEAMRGSSQTKARE